MTRAEYLLEKLGEMSVRRVTGQKVGFGALDKTAKRAKVGRQLDARMKRTARA